MNLEPVIMHNPDLTFLFLLFLIFTALVFFLFVVGSTTDAIFGQRIFAVVAAVVHFHGPLVHSRTVDYGHTTRRRGDFQVSLMMFEIHLVHLMRRTRERRLEVEIVVEIVVGIEVVGDLVLVKFVSMKGILFKVS